MSRRRFLADQSGPTTAALLGANARHLSRVLRARPGQQFEIACNGEVHLATITSVDDERVDFALGDLIPAAPALPLTIYLSVFKFDRFEWALEKLTELGVARIMPVIAERTDAHLIQAAVKRLERWQKIAHQAAQQSRRASPPEIPAAEPLQKLLSQEQGIFLDESESSAYLADFSPRLLAIGPEGGWTARERGAFLAAGWQPASLAPTILRAETAAIAAAAIVIHREAAPSTAFPQK